MKLCSGQNTPCLTSPTSLWFHSGTSVLCTVPLSPPPLQSLQPRQHPPFSPTSSTFPCSLSPSRARQKGSARAHQPEIISMQPRLRTTDVPPSPFRGRQIFFFSNANELVLSEKKYLVQAKPAGTTGRTVVGRERGKGVFGLSEVGSFPLLACVEWDCSGLQPSPRKGAQSAYLMGMGWPVVFGSGCSV